MSTESHRRYLEKQALREAQKALDRHGADHFRTLQFARLKIQTMEPWKRLLLALLGLASGLGAYGVLLADIRWLSGLLFLLAGERVSVAVEAWFVEVEGEAAKGRQHHQRSLAVHIYLDEYRYLRSADRTNINPLK